MSNQPNKTNGAKPAVAHKKNILDDRRIRLALSVLGAIVAWMIVTIIVQPGTSNTIYNVPVDYTYDSSVYTSRGLSIVSAEDKTVNLKLSGDGYTIGGLSASDFVVYPDWSSVRDSGEKTLRLLVRGANGLLNGVTVTMEGSDNTVDVVFDVVEEKTLPVTATTNYLRIADGYILYSTEVSKETVTLSGPSSELSKGGYLHRRGILQQRTDRVGHAEHPSALLHQRRQRGQVPVHHAGRKQCGRDAASVQDGDPAGEGELYQRAARVR